MDWIPVLLKHLALSRLAVAAAFVASTVLYAGPRAAPALVDPVPKEWAAVPLVVMVFSGFLLISWGISAVWRIATRRWVVATVRLASFQLDSVELWLLLGMGEQPTSPLDTHQLEDEQGQFTKLEILEAVSGLERKGLVSFSRLGSRHAFLTTIGRQRALEIQRQIADDKA